MVLTQTVLHSKSLGVLWRLQSISVWFVLLLKKPASRFTCWVALLIRNCTDKYFVPKLIYISIAKRTEDWYVLYQQILVCISGKRIIQCIFKFHLPLLPFVKRGRHFKKTP